MHRGAFRLLLVITEFGAPTVYARVWDKGMLINRRHIVPNSPQNEGRQSDDASEERIHAMEREAQNFDHAASTMVL